MTFAEVFVSLWWLVFPLMGFALGGFGMVLRHRQTQKTLDILSTYAAHGKDPPPEVLRAVYGSQALDGSFLDPGHQPGGPSPAYGPGDYGWSGPWGWGRGWSGWGYWWGPARSWRQFFTLGALATGFGVAAWCLGPGEPARSFVLTAIILGVLAFAALMNALVLGFWKPR